MPPGRARLPPSRLRPTVMGRVVPGAGGSAGASPSRKTHPRRLRPSCASRIFGATCFFPAVPVHRVLPMTAGELFRAGQLTKAIEAQLQEVRSAPADKAKRFFLFELLSFAGDFDRAGK